MVKQVVRSDVEDVLSSIRRLVGETRVSGSHGVVQQRTERLVLTAQHRVPEADGDAGDVARGDVLRLEAHHAVGETAGWQEFEEPPLVFRDNRASEEDASADAGRSHGAERDDYTGETAPDRGPVEAPLVLGPSERRAPARLDVSELTAKIAALETAIARTVDQWEPDGAGRDAYAGTRLPAMDWPENIELDATGRPLGPSGPAGAAATPAPDAGAVAAAEETLENALEEQVIDEETLRALVAEIVRSELQGALGERITRNVRKLVRREIHRVLIAQRLE